MDPSWISTVKKQEDDRKRGACVADLRLEGNDLIGEEASGLK